MAVEVVFGMAKATQLGSAESGSRFTVLKDEDRLLRVLFALEAWPQNWGLYLRVQEGQQFMAPTTADGSAAEFGLEPKYVLDEIWGAWVWIRSIPFVLAFGRPDDLTRQLHRPGELVLDRSAAELRLVLNWADGLEHFSLPMSRRGSV